MKIRYLNYEPRNSECEDLGEIGQKTKIKDFIGRDLYIGDVILPLNGYGKYDAGYVGYDPFILTKRDIDTTIGYTPLMKGTNGLYYYPCDNKEFDEREYGHSFYRIKSYKQLVAGEKWGLYLSGMNDEMSTLVEVVEDNKN